MQRALALFGVISSVAMTCSASPVERMSVTAIAHELAMKARTPLPRAAYFHVPTPEPMIVPPAALRMLNE